MPFVSITRLRVRSWSYLPAFFVQTLRIARQAAKADGNLAVKLLRDHRNTFWTGTSWSSEGSMKAFMRAKPHGPTMRSLLQWCDEAALVHWTQAEYCAQGANCASSDTSVFATIKSPHPGPSPRWNSQYKIRARAVRFWPPKHSIPGGTGP